MTDEVRDAWKVAQITDLHLYGDPVRTLYGLDTLQTLEAVLARLSRFAPACVLATGDLVHDESEPGYRRLKSALAGLGVPVYCITGNHDDRRYLDSMCDGLLRNARQIVGDAWQIVLLESGHQGRVGGELGPAQLDFLEHSLAAYPRHHALICLHHHPVAMGSAWLDRIGLADAEAFFDVLDRWPQVRGVAWGHVHQEYAVMRKGVWLLATPATCIQFRPGTERFELDPVPPGWRWFRLHADGRLETGVDRLNAIPGVLDPSCKGY